MSAKIIASLLTSHIDGDEEQFLSIALQVAAQEARQGRQGEADKLKRLVQKARDRRAPSAPSGQTPIPLARPRSELQGLVESSYPKTKLGDMVLPEKTHNRLTRIVRQQLARAALRDHGQVPATRLLLVGPPGTGKTMTASALAGELQLPLFTLRLENLFSRYFGETAGKLRILFDQIAQTRGVYLLDEFDALGARRNEANDVGEMRRVLNAVLAFMEEPNSTDSLVVAATNHADFLDEALARRFDEVIAYDLPTRDAAEDLIRQKLGSMKLRARGITAARPALAGLSQSELVMAVNQVVKDAILEGQTEIATDTLREALQDRRAFKAAFLRAREA